MMMVIIGCFTVCWFPFAIMFVLLPTSESASNFLFENLLIIEIITWIGKKNKEIIFYFVMIIYISGWVNSTMNPIIYFFMNPTIKAMYHKWYKSFRN